MVQGRVYRRQELAQFSAAIDRDLKALLRAGLVMKLAAGMYYRPRRNAFGIAPPQDRDLVRAFLKTDDFLLTSYSSFNQLGLGLTQVYSNYVVYNHKRFGTFTLGGKRFDFRMVPAYPNKLSPEFLLVDLLNNLENLPDDTSQVLKNLPSHLARLDREKMGLHLRRYGSAAARRILGQTLA
jgi:hypothetical protein